MATSKKEGGICTKCHLKIGSGTKHPCFYIQRKEGSLLVWYLVCGSCKTELRKKGGDYFE